MEFPKEKVIKINGRKITVKPYITTALIDAILDTVIEETSYGVRCAVADTLIMSQCTDIEEFAIKEDDEAQTISIDTYDVFKANGIIDAVTREIRGYDVLLSGIADLSIKDISYKLAKAVDNFTDEFKNINIEEQQQKFKDTLNELKQVEAEKEAILNG